MAPKSETKVKTWRIEWSGVVTRNVGWEEERAETLADARAQFETRYPHRRVIAVSEVAR